MIELLLILAVAVPAVVIHWARRPRCGWCGRPVAMHDEIGGLVLCHYPRVWRLPGRS